MFTTGSVCSFLFIVSICVCFYWLYDVSVNDRGRQLNDNKVWLSIIFSNDLSLVLCFSRLVLTVLGEEGNDDFV